MQPLYPFQIEALRHLKANIHLICISPTGSGKSRIYEEHLKLHTCERAVLVSPLVALARQQKEKVRQLGIESQIQIVSPESLRFEKVWRELKSFRPTILIVDEAHLVLEWGTRFRPSFRKIFELQRVFNLSKSLWLSATLTDEGIRDIKTQLAQKTVCMGEFSFSPRLKIQKIKMLMSERINILSELVPSHKGQGIIFVATRSMTARLQKILGVTSYHAGLSNEERKAIEKSFYRGELRWIVATSAFGMGVDIPNLETVVIFQVPFSLLTLVQMIGRVGRADKPGQALVLWSPEDFQIIANSDRQFFDALNSRNLRDFLEKSLGSYCHQQ